MPLRNTKPGKARKRKPTSSRPQVVSPVKKTPVVSKEASEIIRIDLKRNKAYKSILDQIRRGLGHKENTPMPQDLKPMLATLTNQPFDDKDWQFEIKWDGYRTLAYVQDGNVQLRSRNNLSFNEKYPTIATALQQWPVNALLDGEIVVLSEDGKADFGALQNWPRQKQGRLMYYVFDLLWLEGMDVRNEPLRVRRALLKKVFPESSLIQYSDSIEEYGIGFFSTAKNNGLEGIIAKQAAAPYETGSRSAVWLKIKAETRHEALICGYTKKKDSNRLISSLLLGVPQNGTLHYMGQVGTGFTGRTLQELFRKMNPLFTSTCPFSNVPQTKAPTMWLKPELVCEVKYTELTGDGLMRHPSFQGLREDKTAADLNTEAYPVKRPKRQSKKEAPKGAPSKLIREGEEAVTRTIDGQQLTFSNLTKRYWQKEKITKGDLVNYYHEMAPYIMPYLMDRPQSLNRFPNGTTGKSFFQKDMKGKVAPWLKTFERFSDGSKEAKDFLVCTGAASLLYMVNLGCIELNPWHSRVTSPHLPDWCVLDLDPGAIPFEKVIQTANVVHDLLESLGIPSYPKTSGSTGMHIYIPLGAKYNYEQSRQLAELLATLVHHELPTITSLVRSPEKRKDKIYLDYLQNRPIQTICAPYSVRPKPGATVSAPLDWAEVKKGLKLSRFTLQNMGARVKSEGDLFQGILAEGIDLNAVLQALTRMV